MFPFAADTTISIYNLSQTDVILKRSVELIPKEMESPLFTIISLGKFSYVKQYSKIPDIAKKVAESGFKFKWYVLGGIINQDEYDLFMTRIRDYGLEEYVVSLGEKKNPYPYLAHSDLLVCTSESEACPMIFIEAKALHIPICTTDFGSAPEFVDDGINGNIAPIESLDEKIVKLIEDKSYYEVVKKNVSCFVYDNNTILEKIYSII
jgi:glycosyltransferase involved in cell wall biosynthesis